MATQFLHLDTFGNTPRKGMKHHSTAVGMLNEAGRTASATGHLKEPQSARLLFGRPPTALIPAVRHLSARAKDSLGRKLRSDGSVLGAMVISYPKARLELTDDACITTYQDWRLATLRWLATRFPTTLKCVVEHVDENQLHLHAFLLPPVKTDGQLCWSECHPGLAARKKAADEGKNKTGQNLAYMDAMRALQDEFHGAVSARFDHSRTGPKRERRQREQHLKVAALEQELAQAQALVAALRGVIEKQNTAVPASPFPDVAAAVDHVANKAPPSTTTASEIDEHAEDSVPTYVGDLPEAASAENGNPIKTEPRSFRIGVQWQHDDGSAILGPNAPDGFEQDEIGWPTCDELDTLDAAQQDDPDIDEDPEPLPSDTDDAPDWEETAEQDDMWTEFEDSSDYEEL